MLINLQTLIDEKKCYETLHQLRWSRLKRIHVQKLYRPETGKPSAYPSLQKILSRLINWDLIRQQ